MTHPSDPDPLPQPEEVDGDLAELSAQLGLSGDEAAAAWDAVLDGLDLPDEPETDEPAGERLDVGDLAALFDGKKLDLGEMAKDELIKAVAKKLGIDPEKAGPIVEMILKVLNKPTTKRRRKTTTKKKPKKHTTSASTKPKPKPKTKPKPKPASSSADKPKPKPKTKPKHRPKPSSATKPKPRKRATRSE